MKRTIPVIIDTDPGVDDAVALILALRSPELKVLGITTVFGNVTVEKTTQNARRVLDMMGCPEHGPPVVRGSAGPLVRSFGRRLVHVEEGARVRWWASPHNTGPPHKRSPVGRRRREATGSHRAHHRDGGSGNRAWQSYAGGRNEHSVRS